MQLKSVLLSCLLSCAAALVSAAAEEAPAPAAPVAPATTTVVMKTSMGDIRVALETARAPITSANFLRYVDLKRFDGITFYRAVNIGDDGKYGLVQGGLRSADPRKIFKAIEHEGPAVTGLSHLDGAISMAHLRPGTAQAEFFFVVGDLTDLDGRGSMSEPGYAVFGRVTEGMEVIRAILPLPKSEAAGDGSMKGQMLAEPVRILSVRRAD